MKEFRRPYWFTSTTRDNLTYIKNEIIAYRGSVANPRWMDIDKGLLNDVYPRNGLNMASQASYFKLCVVEADTSRLSQLLRPQTITIGKKKNKRKTTFFELKYDIILSLGLTEHKAQIAWIENVSFIAVSPSDLITENDQGQEVRYVTITRMKAVVVIVFTFAAEVLHVLCMIHWKTNGNIISDNVSHSTIV